VAAAGFRDNVGSVGSTNKRAVALALIGLGISCLVLADDEPQQFFQVTKTERLDFPSGGLLRLKNSIGQVMVEGWNRPDVEITTTKSTKDPYNSQDRDKALKELDQVRIAAERHGDELVITTDFPRYGTFKPLLRGGTRFDLDYRISVPRSARVAIEHNTGFVSLDNVAGDIHVTASQAEIALHLPEDGQYAIDARSKLGDVISDFPGHTQRKLWFLGKRFAHENAAASQKIDLRAGYGDIMILKSRGLKKTATLPQ
jgi:hypothetical protein